MAIISLLITLIVIMLLYFGIRWTYRTITNDDSSDTTTTQTTDTTVGSVDAEGSTTDNTGEAQTGNEALTNLLSGNDLSGEGTVSDEAASTSRGVAAVSDGATSTSTLSTTGGNELPNTGASELLLAIPVLTIALGYFVSRKRQLDR